MESEFIGRKQLFQDLLDIVFSQDGHRHYISILGDGGMGKTMLLNKLGKYINEEYARNKQGVVISYDYRDLMAQSVFALFLDIALKTQELELGFNSNILYNYILSVLMNPNDLRSIIIEVIHILKGINSDKRIVLLEDTLETIQYPSPFVHNIFEVGSYLPNCIAITVGRPEEAAKKHIPEIIQILEKQDWKTHQFVLNAFTESESYEYINDKLFISKEKDIPEKLFLLTGGSPILLSIAVYLLGRDCSLDILDKDIDDIKELQNNHSHEIYQDFLAELFKKISLLKTDLDWAILYLAFLNRRYDKKILKILLGSNDDDLENIEKSIKSFDFLRKSTMYSRYEKELLHDEMQRLVNTYVWEQIDPHKTTRNDIAQKIINEYYLPEIRLRKEITIERSKSIQDLNSSLEYWRSEVDLAEYQNECLDYTFQIDQATGFTYFLALVQEAKERKYNVFARKLLHDGVRNLKSHTMSNIEIEKHIWGDVIEPVH